jgi:DNA-binding protein YbaB
MFNPLKALSGVGDMLKSGGDMTKMAKIAYELQKKLGSMSFTVREGDVEVVMNGNQEVQSISIGGVANESARRAINNVVKQAQQAAAGQMNEITKMMQ